MVSRRQILGEESLLNGTDLPGYKKKSFSISFNRGDIWCEHLDGIHNYSDLVICKFNNDYNIFKKPSYPSLIAINLDETVINQQIISSLSSALLTTEKRIIRIAFVGIYGTDKIKIKKALKGARFTFSFINDFEKAKIWLVKEQ